MSTQDEDGEGSGGPKAPLSARERAKEWRKAAYQKAKAVHKERLAAQKTEPAAIARKELQAAYRRSSYQKQKERHKAAKEADKLLASQQAAQVDEEALAAKEAELRQLVTTADKLTADKADEAVQEKPRRGLRLVRSPAGDC